MPTHLLRTEFSIDECEKHLVHHSAFGSPVESYLTQYTLIVLCAEMQQEVIALAQNRAATIPDAGLRDFTKRAAKDACKHIKIEHLAGYIGMFGDSRKKAFRALEGTDPVTSSSYDNAVEARHSVAHSSGVSITFSELKRALQSARTVLMWMELSLK